MKAHVGQVDSVAVLEMKRASDLQGFRLDDFSDRWTATRPAVEQNVVIQALTKNVVFCVIPVMRRTQWADLGALGVAEATGKGQSKSHRTGRCGRTSL